MNIRTLRNPLLAAGIVVLAGCSAHGYGQKQGVGTLLGAAGGAVAGAQFGSGSGQLAMTAIGTLLGASLGNSVGESLDRADRAYLRNAHATALETNPAGTATYWHNPDTGNHGSIAPTTTYQAPTGEYCREYQQTIVVGGQTQQGYGTACRKPDGDWEIRNRT